MSGVQVALCEWLTQHMCVLHTKLCCLLGVAPTFEGLQLEPCWSVKGFPLLSGQGTSSCMRRRVPSCPASML